MIKIERAKNGRIFAITIFGITIIRTIDYNISKDYNQMCKEDIEHLSKWWLDAEDDNKRLEIENAKLENKIEELRLMIDSMSDTLFELNKDHTDVKFGD